MEIILLIAAGAVGWWLLKVVGLRGASGSGGGEAQALLKDARYQWTDVMRAWGGEVQVDPRDGGHFLIIAKGSPPEVVPFANVRQWGYDPLMNVLQNMQLGYRFKITTNDPQNPIKFIDIRGLNQSVPEHWMAKFNAYINK